MADSTANQLPTDVQFEKQLGQLANFVRVMRQAGLSLEDDLQTPIDDPDFRRSLVEFWRHRGALASSPAVQEVVVHILFTEAEKAAISILGSAKALTQGQAKGEVELPIRYSEDTLQACAKENAEKGTDWRLVYLRGNSLREGRERVGTNRKRQPCFYDNNWWLGANEDSWVTEKFEPGYYLIDFKGRFSQTSWQNQEKAIQELGTEFERAHEAMVTEAALRIFEATGERLLPNWYHWGRSLDSYGFRVNVGNFVSEGWHVDFFHPDYDVYDFLRVCLLRKFQS